MQIEFIHLLVQGFATTMFDRSLGYGKASKPAFAFRIIMPILQMFSFSLFLATISLFILAHNPGANKSSCEIIQLRGSLSPCILIQLTVACHVYSVKKLSFLLNNFRVRLLS